MLLVWYWFGLSFSLGWFSLGWFVFGWACWRDVVWLCCFILLWFLFVCVRAVVFDLITLIVV